MKRSRVALLVSELEGEYANLLCRGVMDFCKEKDINLIICAGKVLKGPYQFQYQYNTIYDVIRQNKLDGIIIASGNLCNFITSVEFEKFCDGFDPVKMVSISIPVGKRPTVLINNCSGLETVLQHLITVHGKKRIAFISGPENNVEAQERLQVYKNVLEKNGLPFEVSLVMVGDFTQYSGVRAVETLLSRKVAFDAVAVANDEMALFAMNTLKEKGFKVPEEIAVTGFDNIESTIFSTPPLTTVTQPVYLQAKKAAEMLYNMLAGLPETNQYLPTEPVYRESCGCFSFAEKEAESDGNSDDSILEILNEIKCNTTPEGTLVIQKFVKEALRINALEFDATDSTESLIKLFYNFTHANDFNDSKTNPLEALIDKLREDFLLRGSSGKTSQIVDNFYYKIRVLLMEEIVRKEARRWAVHHFDIKTLRQILNLMVLNVHSSQESLESIIPELKAINIKSGAIFLYKNTISHTMDRIWKTPKKVLPAISYDNDSIRSWISKKEILTSEMVEHLFTDDRRKTLLMNPLFFTEEQFGVIFCELELADSFLLESLCIEISCALKLNGLIEDHRKLEGELNKAFNKLEIYNQKLSNLSQTDELTGLYNRRGFLMLAQESLNLARNMKKGGTLFFADLDGLKKINDKYGHEEGDFAIKKTGDLLKSVFRNMDIISRMGGDEFTIFTVDTNENFVHEIRKRINSVLVEFNRCSGKPYDLSMSIGSECFDCVRMESIKMLLEKADKKLYEHKMLKKNSR